jgi:hypothetical protein
MKLQFAVQQQQCFAESSAHGWHAITDAVSIFVSIALHILVLHLSAINATARAAARALRHREMHTNVLHTHELKTKQRSPASTQ